MDELLKFNMARHGIIKNSAMKYVQILKEILSRAESLEWMQSKAFDEYRCSYTLLPDHGQLIFLPLKHWVSHFSLLLAV
jgi:hypothetical protein